MMNNPLELERKANEIREVFGSSELPDDWVNQQIDNMIENNQPGDVYAIGGFVFRRTEHSVRIEIDPSLFYWLIPVDYSKEMSRENIQWDDYFEDWGEELVTPKE